MRYYLIGSLRNPRVPVLAQAVRALGYEVFDDWYAAGPEADDYWQKYEKARGHSYLHALEGHAAKHVFDYDKSHLDTAEGGILLAPAGRSSYLELGYLLGQGKPGYIVLPPDNERWDVMVKFATEVFESEDELLYKLELDNATRKEVTGYWWDGDPDSEVRFLYGQDVPDESVEQPDVWGLRGTRRTGPEQTQLR